MSELQSVEFDVAVIVGGNADSIVAKLSDLSDGQLVELATAENGLSKPRKAVLDAIAAEQAGRAEAAGQTDPALLAAQADAAEAQVQRIAELEAALAVRDQRIADLEAAIADGQTKAGAKAPKPQLMSQAAVLPDLEAVSEVRVICVGADDKSVPGLPPLLFMPWQFTAENGGLVLDAPIAFARELAEAEVHALYLLADGKKGLRASLVQPIAVGGGKAMELPKGHVLFVTAPAPAPTA